MFKVQLIIVLITDNIHNNSNVFNLCATDVDEEVIMLVCEICYTKSDQKESD